MSAVYRELMARGLQFGRARQSAQTGFLHFNPQAGENGVHDTIPIVENALFALALLRSKDKENIQEARQLLDRLMGFQNSDEGSFPVYLHEYPSCSNPFIAAELLPPLTVILRDFGAVLGSQTLERLRKGGDALLQQAEREVPNRLAYQMEAAVALWRGEQPPIWREEEAPLTSAQLGRALLLRQADHPDLRWFHEGLGVYVAPPFYELQQAGFPHQGVLASIAAHWLGAPLPAGKPTLYDLQATLLSPSVPSLGEREKLVDEEGMKGPFHWRAYRGRDYAVATIAHSGQCPASIHPGFHSLRFLWGKPGEIHSLATQLTSEEGADFEWREGGVSLWFDLPDNENWKEKGRCREVALYVSHHPSLILRVAGNQATTFQLGQELSVEGSGLRADLKFTLVEGEGRFFGHVVQGNRPAEKERLIDKRHDAFDWVLHLRTLEKVGSCRIRLDLSFR